MDVQLVEGIRNVTEPGALDCAYRASGRAAPRTSPLTYDKPTPESEPLVIGLEA